MLIFNLIFSKSRKIGENKLKINKYKNINAKIYLKNGKVEIRINSNSSKSEEYLIIHEVTHAIETSKMKKLVLDYVDKHSVYQQLLDELKLTYETNDVSSEVLANISGQLFGNQEFIKNLSLEKPKVFKRITNSLITIANKITNNYYETLFVKDLKNKWMIAYRNITNEQAVINLKNLNLYSLESLQDGTVFVKTETGLFTKNNGMQMTQREIYKTLIGKKIGLYDGTNIEIVGRLPNKNMYNEFFKRYPRAKGINDVKKINCTINENMKELLAISKNISTHPDVDGRHLEQNITDFNTREAMFYDGNRAYNLTLSIAILQDGKKVAYAKKMLKVNNELLFKIKQEGMSSTSDKGRSSQFPQVDINITQSKDNVKLPS